MHIKSVVLEGFKCYKDRISPEPFSPRHNVVGVCCPTSIACPIRCQRIDNSPMHIFC